VRSHIEVSVKDNFYGERAEQYLARKATDTWHQESDAMVELLLDVPDGGRVLDVPFGTGRYNPLFNAKNMQIVGVDASSEMLEAACAALGGAEYQRCELHVARADRMPLADASFDLLVCCRFLTSSTLETALQCLPEFRRVCSGMAIIFLRNRSSETPAPKFERIEDNKIGWVLDYDDTKQLLAENGFCYLRDILVPTDKPHSFGEKRAWLVQAVEARRGKSDNDFIRRVGDKHNAKRVANKSRRTAAVEQSGKRG
jgi:SAM-dependent methyltransferase